jgi:DNA-binding transcriptional ArsR family regulator
MDLEMILASSCRGRILKALWKLGRANVMELVREINSTYSQVNPNLQILEKEGIIFDERFGRMRIIRLNKENPKTLLLLQALRILNTQIDDKSRTTRGKRNSVQQITPKTIKSGVEFEEKCEPPRFSGKIKITQHPQKGTLFHRSPVCQEFLTKK